MVEPTLQLPPLSLYIHLPWCVQKCPYCDFNSHAIQGPVPESRYVDALLADLELDLPKVWGRVVQTIFIGGGTPSLFSAESMDRLLSGVRARLPIAPNAEITMEANPGAVEHDRFEAYRAAGINRISLGVQSFDPEQLRILGRVHDADEAHRAIQAVQASGIRRLNLDLMWALPGQTVDNALSDLSQALSYQPEHLSHYQLTLEPNTVFAAHPPALPDEDTVIDMQASCRQQLQDHGYDDYEISAWSQPDAASRHNLNYWCFGDYLGIGAGAHGKITLPAEGRIRRSRKKSHPRPYLKGLENQHFIAEDWPIAEAQLAFEYFLNRSRLKAPIDLREFEGRTGLGRNTIEDQLARAVELGLLIRTDSGQQLEQTDRGRNYLNDLQALFL